MTPARYPRILLPARLACPATLLPLGRAGTPSRDAPGYARLFSLLNLGAAQVAPAFPPSGLRPYDAAPSANLPSIEAANDSDIDAVAVGNPAAAVVRRISSSAQCWGCGGQSNWARLGETGRQTASFRGSYLVALIEKCRGRPSPRLVPPSGLRPRDAAPSAAAWRGCLNCEAGRAGDTPLVGNPFKPLACMRLRQVPRQQQEDSRSSARPALDPSGAAGYATLQGACNLGPFQTPPARNDNDLTGSFVSPPLRRGFGPGFFAVAA